MKGLRASNFKRIHLGLLLDLLLMFLVPAVIIALLALITRQVAAAGMDEATVETLLRCCAARPLPCGRSIPSWCCNTAPPGSVRC